MSGFPARPSRSTFGPTYEDERPVTDASREIAASIFNLDFWQLAGVGKTVPKAVLICSVAGAACTTDYQYLAFDPDGDVSTLTWTYNGAGDYDIAFASQYPDQNENNTNLALTGGIALAMGATPLVGSVELTSAYEATIHFASDPSEFIVLFW